MTIVCDIKIIAMVEFGNAGWETYVSVCVGGGGCLRWHCIITDDFILF